MISPTTVAQVREQTDLVALIGESVPSLKRRGRSFVGLCPFHREKTPSFHVNPERGFFHCFGCKAAGSGVDFLMKLEGMSFPEAVRALAERAGIEVEEEQKGEKSELERKKKERDDLFAANHAAATFFERMLREHPHAPYAIQELEKRGLRPSFAAREEPEAGGFTSTDDELQAFRVGYAPSGWDTLTTFFRAQGISPVLGERVGLLVPRTSGQGSYDRFRHRLMFAVLDAQGRVVAFSGRALEPLPEDDTPARDKPAKYINSPESLIYVKGDTLFGLHQARHAIRTAEQALVVEGNFDVLSLHARGAKNVVAPLGTAFTLAQAKLLRRYAPEVVLLFDADAAGKKAVRAARAAVREAGLTAKVATLPEGMDPDEFVRKRGPDALVDLVAAARGMLEYLLEAALDETFAQADAREKSARLSEVSKLLAEEDDPVVRQMAKAYADQLAGRLDLKTADGMGRHIGGDIFRALEAHVKKALAEAEQRDRAARAARREREGEGEPVAPSRTFVAPRTTGTAERREIVGALLEAPELLGDGDVIEVLDLLEGVSATTVAALRRTVHAGAPLEAFLELLSDPRIRTFASERIAAPKYASAADAKAALLAQASWLKKNLLGREVDALAREQSHVAGDWESEARLAEEASRRVRRRHGIED